MKIRGKVVWVSAALVAALLLCLGGPFAKAQDSKINLFGGYSFASGNCFGTCVIDPGFHGYAAAFTYNFNRHIGLEANFSGHNGTPTIYHNFPTASSTGGISKQNENIYIYTFGPRVALAVGNFSLFSHFLVGATHIDGNSTNQCIDATGTGGTTCDSTAVVTQNELSGNGFATKIGGGVDWNHKSWGIRILEVDFVHGQIYATNTPVSCPDCGKSSQNQSGNAFELSTGITFNFGHMN